MTINNRGLQGQPVLPYVDYRIYAGADAFVDLTFLDHTGVGQIPVSLQYQLDDITNVVNMIPQTTITPTQFQMTLQLPGSLLQMTHQWQGSQLCQLKMIATLSDMSNIPGVTIIELCAIQTPNGF